VIVVPTAASAELREYEHASPRHRAALVSLAFADLPGVEIDYDDLSLGSRSSLGQMLSRHASKGDAWIVADASALPAWKASEERLAADAADRRGGWERLTFAVFADVPVDSWESTVPPTHVVLRGPAGPAAEALRAMHARGEPIDEFVPAQVAAYIRRHRLFLPGLQSDTVEFDVDEPALLVVHDERNPAAVALAERYRGQAGSRPDMILVIGGDGTMLRAIREHWKRRLPFLGLNAGHLGFLMNPDLPCPLAGMRLVSVSLPLLRVDARFPDGHTSTSLAYGDAWMERALGQSAWLRIDVNGATRIEKVVGDGMLVATAPGSSAYARALGAVPVPIDSPTLTLAGSNIFQPRFWKPMILPASSRITLTSIDTIGKRPVRAFVDGHPLGIVTELSMRQSLTASVELAFTRGFEPSAKLLDSLFPRDVS
jgi:NAD kinase